ncbi:MAG: flagellar filament capping protein FliD [Acidimicrobiia bacterium]
MTFASGNSSIDGLISGLNTTQIISQLMQVESQPQAQLKNAKASAQSIVTAYQAINAKFVAFQAAARGLNKDAGWQAYAATTSDGTAVAATAGTGALPGSLSFVVNKLAQANTIIGTTTYTSLGQTLGTTSFLVSKASRLGFSELSGSGLTAGSHTVEVVQDSAAATKTGDSALGASTVIATGVNDTIDAEINGVAATLTIDAGTYTRAQLAAKIQAASNGTLTATVDGSNRLVLDTVAEGSSASVKITGGTALTDLHLSTDGAAITGTDGVVKVDGTTNTVTDTTATQVLTSGTGGAITAALSGGLRSGTTTATNVSYDGTFGGLTRALNAANAGIAATAIQTGTNAYRLQLASTSSGAASKLTISPQAGFTEVTAAQDAALTVGSGPGAFTVTSASNTVSTLLPGVTLTLKKADDNVTQTVTVAADGGALADKVQAMVDAANSTLATIKQYASYNATTKTAGVLLGDIATGSLQSKAISAITDAIAGNSIGSPGLAGLSFQRDGTVAFDRSTFLAAYQNDPTAVAGLFRQGGTATNSKVSFLAADDTTKAGTYSVLVTQAAEQATATGTALGGGTVTAGETIDVKVGTTTVTYSATAGESLSSIASHLSDLLGAQNLGVLASVESNKLVLRSTDYGSGVTFDVRTSTTAAGQTGIASAANQWETHTGVDIAGKINNVAATGHGQFLAAPATDNTLGALTLKVTATPADVISSQDFGTFTYVPGVAQKISSIADSAINSATGSLTTAVKGENDRMADLDSQITAWDTLLAQRQQTLKNQFSQMESQLAKLKNQSSYLSTQLASLNNNWAGNSSSSG